MPRVIYAERNGAGDLRIENRHCHASLMPKGVKISAWTLAIDSELPNLYSNEFRRSKINRATLN